MAPCEEQQHVSERRRNEEEGELRQPRGYISEDMISPVSLLRSDRFAKSRLTVKPPIRAQLWEQADIRPAAILTEARPRTANVADKEALQNDPGHSNLQDRMANAPQKVRPITKPKKYNTMERGRTYPNPPTQQSGFESCHHEFSDRERLLTGQSWSTNFRTQTSLSPLDRTGTWNEDTQQDNKRSPQRITRASPTSKSGHPIPRPDRLSLSGPDAARQLLSQSPIRPSSAPRISESFQPSPLKARPTTSATRRPSKAEAESSNVDNQLHEHIRAFEAQQELSHPEGRISNSPIMDRPGNPSESWPKRQQLPDPSTVTKSEPLMDLDKPDTEILLSFNPNCRGESI